MAAKKTSTKPAPKKISKSDFIRSQPATMSAAEVVEKAKGIMKLDPALVYKVRGRAAGKAKTPKKTPKKSAAKKTATKASPKNAAKPSASDFIRSQPVSMTAAEIVRQGAGAALTFTPNLVYAVRAASKKSGKAKAKGKPGPKPAAKATAITGEVSATVILSRLVIEHGIGRVRAMLAEVEKRVEQVLSGR